MSNLLSKPISKIEYVVHFILFALTAGGWLLFIIARILIFRAMSKEKSLSSKSDILRKVNELNAKQKAPSGTITYIKRTFATEEEAEDLGFI
jgi:hypothetical protein